RRFYLPPQRRKSLVEARAPGARQSIRPEDLDENLARMRLRMKGEQRAGLLGGEPSDYPIAGLDTELTEQVEPKQVSHGPSPSPPKPRSRRGCTLRLSS